MNIRSSTSERRSSRSMLVAAVAAAAAVAANALPARAQTAALDKGITVNGQGSTFMSNFVEQCKADVKTTFGINIGYQPTGSGAGRSGFISGTVDFAGSDVPFSATELNQLKDKKFSYIPVTIGGIAIIYKLKGVDDLKLSGPTLAGIFAGEIQKWDHAAIAKENPDAKLPGDPIKVVVRSDNSGTSSVFTDYLASAGKGAWTKGVTGTFPVPSGNGIAQRGSDGVTNYLQGGQGDGAITYAETSFATERKLSVARVINTAGSPVLPDPANVTEAMRAAAINDDGTLLLNYNTTSPKAYPISTTAYLIVPDSLDAKKGDVLRTFVAHSLGECQSSASKLGYAPLPTNLIELGRKAADKINPGSAPVPTLASSGSGTPANTPANTPTTAAAANTPTTAAAAVTPTTASGAAGKATPTTKPATKTTKKSTKATKKK